MYITLGPLPPSSSYIVQRQQETVYAGITGNPETAVAGEGSNALALHMEICTEVNDCV